MPLFPPSGSSSGVTSVSGTAPVASSGGTTPAISMAAATDSVNGYLTSTDHTTLTSLSGYASGVAPNAPKGVMFIANKTGVDLKTNAATTIFTVPTSNTFVFQQAFIVVTAVTGGAAVTFTCNIRESSANAQMSPSTASSSAAPVVNKVWVTQTTIGGSPFATCAAGNNGQISITTGFTTSTTVTGTVWVQGFYY